jgi:hypothetical protein
MPRDSALRMQASTTCCAARWWMTD